MKDKEAVWDIRRAFDSQLSKLWGKEPFGILKDWEDSNFSAGAPNFLRKSNGQTFVPFYGRDVGIGVKLEITLLTGMPSQKRVLEAGDLDNRIKRLIDALRVPKGHGEMSANLVPDSRWYCLIEDDNVVTEIKANLGTYLASDDASEAFAFIKIRPSALRVTTSNLEMLI
jgi:hypothetical protein